MAGDAIRRVPMGDGTGNAALQQSPRLSTPALSSLLDRTEAFLGAAGFDRAPWLVVGLAAGIASWFWLAGPGEWLAMVLGTLLAAIAAAALWRDREDRVRLRHAVTGLGLAIAMGVILIWCRSALIGAEPIEAPRFGMVDGRVLERIEQPAEQRVRLVLAVRDPVRGRAMRVRVNVPEAQDDPAFAEGSRLRFNARLMPPAPPMLPGGYDFARTAWFEGFAATGSVIGSVELVEPAPASANLIGRWQRALSGHVREQLGGSAGTIAAAFASGDRGAIGDADEDAMRDAGLTHLLSISGLHVSAVIAAAYVLAIRLLALWPALALRVRLPLVAAGLGAAAGIAYTLLTGAQVPTVRSCVAAMLVLGALALGREPLSLRMVAVAATFVLLLWPETLIGPSFQMSFSAVIAIVALHSSRPIKAFLAAREEPWLARFGRRTVMLMVTGFVIELALMPVVLFHFHRAGLYGAFANVIAIPLVTFLSMPLIAIALALDLVGLGAPAWWLAGRSLDLMLAIAHFTAAQPGAVKLAPSMGEGTFALFAIGLLWLALWRGRARLWGFVPVAAAIVLLLRTPVPDLLVSGDGRHVAIAGDGPLILLRDTRSDFTRDNLTELAATDAEPVALVDHPDARCSPDFCIMTIRRDAKPWTLMMARSRNRIEERALAAACERADIVVADRWLPRSCNPRWLKADRNLLERSGGLAITLADGRIREVADSQGQHGWWRGGRERD